MATFGRKSRPVIRMSLRGCTNRPFYHIVVMNNRQPRDAKVKYQLGVYDPMPNIHNEVLVSMDFDKLRHFISQGVEMKRSVKTLLGLAGYLPIHPGTRMMAHRRQQKLDDQAKVEAEATEAAKHAGAEAS